MKKKLLLVLCSAVMTMSLVACGGDKPEDKGAAQKPAITDGTYEAETKADDEGKGARVALTVKEGKITEAKYNEFTKDGDKRNDEKYNKMMEEKVKTSPEKFEPEFEKQVVEKQNAEIDVVTGATNSTAQAKQLFEAALANAKEGKTDKAVVEIKK
ncbi:FMN-binding protein [uncultured Clostridium sp.]|uniref:FMN-binding protein n=1 Tax=uncultured Clostridium sp. TaxID=59620 RepID=UPI002614C7B0|nr:FMN-binding protein [uncultured Clostridium sp.]